MGSWQGRRGTERDEFIKCLLQSLCSWSSLYAGDDLNVESRTTSNSWPTWLLCKWKYPCSWGGWEYPISAPEWLLRNSSWRIISSILISSWGAFRSRNLTILELLPGRSFLTSRRQKGILVNNDFPSHFNPPFEWSKSLPLYIIRTIGMRRIRRAHKLFAWDLDPVDRNIVHDIWKYILLKII